MGEEFGVGRGEPIRERSYLFVRRASLGARPAIELGFAREAQLRIQLLIGRGGSRPLKVEQRRDAPRIPEQICEVYVGMNKRRRRCGESLQAFGDECAYLPEHSLICSRHARNRIEQDSMARGRYVIGVSGLPTRGERVGERGIGEVDREWYRVECA